MSTVNGNDENNNIPEIKNRDEVIILDKSIECLCGRTKERVHCVNCGRVKLYASAVTAPIRIPNSINIMKGCISYRCEACGYKFNDIDWYFNCHAPDKPDWSAFRKNREKHDKEVAFKEWVQLIQTKVRNGERITYNDDTQCKKATGMSATNIIKMLMDSDRPRYEMRLSSSEIEENKQALRDKIVQQEEIARTAETQQDKDQAIDLAKFLKEKLEKLENGALKND